MYRPLQMRQGNRTSTQTSLMAKRGVNLRDLPQLLTPEFALYIKNYIINSDGGLRKRKGIKKIADNSTTNGPTMYEKYTSNYYIAAFADKLVAVEKGAGTITTINTYSSSSDRYEGVRYGDYFFVTNGKEGIGRIQPQLAYDAQTANFTVGATVTGGTSGATAVILADADGGATGTLTLGSLNGVFQDNETITGSSGGSATVTGTLSWSYTTVSGSPTAQTLQVVGARLYAGVGATVRYSDVDDGTNPPFTNWTVGTGADDPGEVAFRNAGTTQSIEGLGDIIVVWGDNGKWAFFPDVIDSGGTLVKVDRVVLDRVDFGGSRATLVTDQGIYYVNEGGLWQLISLGQPNIPFSDQEQQNSILLGNTYFDDVDLTNADMVYDTKNRLLLITCAKDSATNNFVIVYNTEFQAFSFFDGWNINRFLKDDAEIHAVSSINDKFYQVFSGDEDDGNDIYTEYYQELQTGSLETRQMLLGFYIHGFLSPASSVKVCFDIYTREGLFSQDKTCWTWTASSSQGLSVLGWGASSFGGTSWGGGGLQTSDTQGLVEDFAGARPRIGNYQRIRVKITENSKVNHILNWFSVHTKVKAPIRRRNLVEVT